MTLESLSQLLAILAYSSARYLLLGYAFALLYRCAGYVEFTFGSAFVVAPITVAALLAVTGNPILAFSVGAFAPALALGLAMACVSSIARGDVQKPMGPNPFIASLGVFFIIESTASLMVGDAAVQFPFDDLRVPVEYLPLTVAQLTTILGSLALVGFLAFIVNKTRFGLRLRAWGESEEMLLELGQRMLSLRMALFAIVYLIAGLAGILLALDLDPDPRMGLEAILIGAFVALLSNGNLGIRLLAGAIFIALIEQLSGYLLGGNLKNIALFGSFFILLYFRSRQRGIVALLTGGQGLRV